jgi:hypothetical protein
MQTIQSIRTVKRMKRRQLATLLASATFAGVCSMNVLLAQEKLVQTPVSELSKVPAVRSIGIKLINPNGPSTPIASQTAPSLAIPAPALALPVPASKDDKFATLAPSLPSLPSSPLPLPSTQKSNPSAPRTIDRPQMDKEFALPPAGVTTPIAAINAPATLSTPNRLEAPPVLDLPAKPANGKVVVKLSADGASGKSPVSSAAPADSKASSVASVPGPQVGPPAKMPSLVLSGNTGKPTATQGVAIAVNHEPVRISMNDDSHRDVLTKPRLPELVKTKAAQISTVVVAETAELVLPEKPSVDESTPAPALNSSDSKAAAPMLAIDESSKTSPSNGIERIDLSKTANNSKPIASPVGFVSLSPAEDESKPKKEASEAVDKPEVTPIPAPNRPAFDSKYAQAQPSASIELETQTATAIDIPGTIKSVAVQNELICRALHNDRTVSFVGDQSGSTLVLIWTNQSPAPQLIRINVSQPWQKPASTQGDIRDVQQVVAQAFPASKLNIVTNEDGTIEVRGTTETEEQAIRVLELVRKLCLVPVKDKVTVGR